MPARTVHNMHHRLPIQLCCSGVGVCTAGDLKSSNGSNSSKIASASHKAIHKATKSQAARPHPSPFVHVIINLLPNSVRFLVIVVILSRCSKHAGIVAHERIKLGLVNRRLLTAAGAAAGRLRARRPEARSALGMCVLIASE